MFEQLAAKILQNAKAINGVRDLCQKAIDIIDGFERRLEACENFVNSSFSKQVGEWTPNERKLKKRIKVLEEQLDEVIRDLQQLLP